MSTTAPYPGSQRYDTRGRRIKADRTSRAGRAPRNKGRKFPPQALRALELQQLLQACAPDSKFAGSNCHLGGLRMRTLIVFLWRTGMRIQEALDLEERDLNPEELQVTVRCGKGGKRRVIGMDPFGWQVLNTWLDFRRTLPPGPVFCVVSGATAGGPVCPTHIRSAMRRVAVRAGVRTRVHPHCLRHTFAVEAWREGIDVVSISQQLGHSRLDITQAYLVSLGADDLITPVTTRKAPTVPIDLGTPVVPLPFSGGLPMAA